MVYIFIKRKGKGLMVENCEKLLEDEVKIDKRNYG